MDGLIFSLLVSLCSLAAGLIGALTGLGGGVVITPLLTLVFGVDIRYAIGASLVSVIATSSGAAAAYVKEGFTNIRIGMFLEIATTTGALVGVLLAMRLPAPAISVIFGLILAASSILSTRPQEDKNVLSRSDRIAGAFRLVGDYPAIDGKTKYVAENVPLGFALMFVAGIISSLLGIGSGAVKVLAMDRAMKLPFKVSAATSNFMIGVTAAAGSGIYLSKGYINPGIAMPVMIGVLIGSSIGARYLFSARTATLRTFFNIIVFALAVEMAYSGIKGLVLK